MGEENRVLTDAARCLESAARKIRIAACMFDEQGLPTRHQAKTIKCENITEAKALIAAAEARLG